MAASLFRTPRKRAVLIVLIAGVAVAAGLRLVFRSEPEVDPASAAKAEQIRSELMDYAPPESIVPDHADPVTPAAPQQHPSREPKPRD